MKKSISAFLCIVMILCLVSCGTEKQTEEKKKSTEKKQEEPEIVWTDYEDVESDEFDLRLSITPKRDLSKYEETVQTMEKDPVEEGKIVFYGSSGFTMWSIKHGNPDLESVLKSSTGEKVCVNRAFGGSTMHELCYYYDRLVKPYKPKALVITSFINDETLKYSNEEVMKLLQWLCSRARKDFPGIRFYITDFRPNLRPFTLEQLKARKEINAMLLAYAKVHTDVKVLELSKEPMYYIDEESAKNATYNDLNKAIFLEDNLHFTPEGYRRFAEVFKRELADELG